MKGFRNKLVGVGKRGEKVFAKVPVRAKCPKCNGRRRVACFTCRGVGKDPRFKQIATKLSTDAKALQAKGRTAIVDVGNVKEGTTLSSIVDQYGLGEKVFQTHEGDSSIKTFRWGGSGGVLITFVDNRVSTTAEAE